LNVSFEQLKSMVGFAKIIEQGSLTAAAKLLFQEQAVGDNSPRTAGSEEFGDCD
jgi:hypothetical protein